MTENPTPPVPPGPLPEEDPRGYRYNPLSKRAGRTLIISFFVVTVAVIGFLTRGLAPYINHIRYEAKSSLNFYKCMGVLSGDTIRVVSNRTAVEKVVRIAGIQAPPRPGSPGATAFVAATGCPAHELLNLSGISRNALQIWVYKHLLDLEFTNHVDDHGFELVYAEKNGVDIGYKQLRAGQARVTDMPQKYRTDYLVFEQESKDSRAGVWRFLPPIEK